MKNIVSIFEKLLITAIALCFGALVLVQIFVSNDVLYTLRANEQGTPVSFEESIAYTKEGIITFSLSEVSGVEVLLNGEEVTIENPSVGKSISLPVLDGDVLEIKNIKDRPVTVHLLNTSDNFKHPKKGLKYECEKGITYLFKVELGDIS